jgi:transcriptional regulator with XRE-family HTH domain
MEGENQMLFRSALGSELRASRIAQSRTLRDVAREARVSLGYLSEVERGQKEASSELLAAICNALNIQLSTLLGDVTSAIAKSEKATLAVVKPIDEKISDAA